MRPVWIKFQWLLDKKQFSKTSKQVPCIDRLRSKGERIHTEISCYLSRTWTWRHIFRMLWVSWMHRVLDWVMSPLWIQNSRVFWELAILEFSKQFHVRTGWVAEVYDPFSCSLSWTWACWHAFRMLWGVVDARSTSLGYEPSVIPFGNFLVPLLRTWTCWHIFGLLWGVADA